MTEQEQEHDENQSGQGQSREEKSVGKHSGCQETRGWRLAGSLLAMSALGLSGFSFLGWLAAARENRAVTEVRVSAVRSVTAVQAPPSIVPLKQSPAASLQQGLRSTLQAAQGTQQRGQRAQATTAIDAARRAAKVGDFALGGSYSQVLQHLEDARRALQDGRGQAAVNGQLSAALEALKSVPVGNAKAPTSLVAYQGATVINPQGLRIGTLDRIDKMTGEAQITLGEQPRLGFIPKGGKQTRILARDLIFGSRGTLGEILVMMPTSDTAPDHK